jgi:hypothetical protein
MKSKQQTHNKAGHNHPSGWTRGFGTRLCLQRYAGFGKLLTIQVTKGNNHNEQDER